MPKLELDVQLTLLMHIRFKDGDNKLARLVKGNLVEAVVAWNDLEILAWAVHSKHLGIQTQ